MFNFLKQIFASAPSIDTETYLQDYHKKNNHVLIDVRTPGEFKGGHLAKAKNIPLNTIDKQLKQIPKNKTVILMCQTGSRSSMATKKLVNAGYEDVLNLKGGMMRWQGMGNSLK